jgi:hypothetical protein
MFDIREIKNKVPSYKEFGRLKESGCKRNYDTAAPVITPLTSFEWRPTVFGKNHITKTHDHISNYMIPSDFFDPICFVSRVVNGRDLKRWKEANNG